jgi:cytosine deaminase
MTCSLVTNNVLEPFTPFGVCSLSKLPSLLAIQIANLYATAAQLGISQDPARASMMHF